MNGGVGELAFRILFAVAMPLSRYIDQSIVSLLSQEWMTGVEYLKANVCPAQTCQTIMQGTHSHKRSEISYFTAIFFQMES